jgi:SulP family sulfate permease
MFSFSSIAELARQNWKAGLTVALISVPLSIALSVASGAGPVPGIITGVWATLIAGFFGGSNYNIVGAAGALTTVLFAATLAAPLGLGAAVLPLLALATGGIIFLIWLLRADRFLYYIPSSVMYGFAGGVAFLIAASQLFDATGLSALKRTGHFTGDIELFIQHFAEVHTPTFGIFLVFIVGILAWKRYVKMVPAVIPAALVGIGVGVLDTLGFISIGLTTLGDKFGAFTGSLMMSVPWATYGQVVADPEQLRWVLGAAGTIALIAVLETLITAQIADKLTKTQFSSRKELLGLALANLGSGSMGGLPATGVFIRTGANIKAGATHKIAAVIAAVVTAGIALIALPFFSYIPMAVIAAILANTALGLLKSTSLKSFGDARGRASLLLSWCCL